MNLRPPGYEPGELPGCSTPRRGRHHSTALSLIALAFLVAILAVAASIAFLVVRGIALWRDLRAFTGRLARDMERLSDSVERIAANEPTDFDELETALARMRSSQERLAILTNALGRVREQWADVAGVYPTK